MANPAIDCESVRWMMVYVTHRVAVEREDGVRWGIDLLVSSDRIV
jgi:hypothetical protein